MKIKIGRRVLAKREERKGELLQNAGSIRN
jgi:hypothetical protein